jgi:hypothetical protein
MSQPKKKFPHSCSKKQLFDMYCLDVPSREIRDTINGIIKENRKIETDAKVSKHHVAHSELSQFVAIYGLPRGYEY